MDSESHIVPVLIGDAKKCKALTDTLLREYHFYLQPINYPTVPENTERVRITPGPLHSEASLERLAGALDELWTRLDLPRTEPVPARSTEAAENLFSVLGYAPQVVTAY
jgi:5-aminolevulinate synthase